jgi:hypothetical protein
MAKNITVTKKTGEDLIITVQDEIVVPPIPPSPAFKDHIIPGKIQFEDYDTGGQGKGYSDTTAANQGGTYRQDGVDIEGSKNIAYTVAGEWLNYTLKQVTAGIYRLSAYVASVTTIGRFTVSLDGKVIGTFSVPNTGSWTTYKAIAVNVDVPAGAKVLRVDIQEGQWNGDYLEFVPFSNPPIPPTTGGITSGHKEAIETAAPGSTVLFAKNDNLPIGQINIPTGVNVNLGGSTLIGTVAGGFNQDKPMFRMGSNSKLFNGSINGKNIISSMITASGDNIQIDGINGQDCNWLGIWLNGARNSKVSNFKLRNTSGATTSWASGELCFSNLNNVEISGFDISSDNKAKGYGMKAMYMDSTLTSVRIHSGKIDMHADSVWNNGQSKNIGLEVHQTKVNGLEVYECDFRNQMSLSYQYQGGKTVVRDCVFDMAKSTYIIEHILDGLEFYGNTCKNWQMITANFVEQPYKWANTNVHSNQFLQPSGIPSWGGAFYISKQGVVNFRVFNNTIEIKRGQKPSLVRYQGTTGGVNNIEAENTIREV